MKVIIECLIELATFVTKMKTYELKLRFICQPAAVSSVFTPSSEWPIDLERNKLVVIHIIIVDIIIAYYYVVYFQTTSATLCHFIYNCS
jgi:hypothetical protein